MTSKQLSDQHNHPALPGILKLPLKMLPGRLQYIAIGRTLNTLFNEPLREGELEFLYGRTVNINIEDAELAFSIRLNGGRLLVDHTSARPDLTLGGNIYAFLLLGTRREDADTLFFNRRLKSEGDTELGLFVKNFLDGLEPDSLPAYKTLDSLMQNALRFADMTPAMMNRLPHRIRRVMES